MGGSGQVAGLKCRVRPCGDREGHLYFPWNSCWLPATCQSHIQGYQPPYKPLASSIVGSKGRSLKLPISCTISLTSYFSQTHILFATWLKKLRESMALGGSTMGVWSGLLVRGGLWGHLRLSVGLNATVCLAHDNPG